MVSSCKNWCGWQKNCAQPPPPPTFKDSSTHHIYNLISNDFYCVSLLVQCWLSVVQGNLIATQSEAIKVGVQCAPLSLSTNGMSLLLCCSVASDQCPKTLCKQDTNAFSIYTCTHVYMNTHTYTHTRVCAHVSYYMHPKHLPLFYPHLVCVHPEIRTPY